MTNQIHRRQITTEVSKRYSDYNDEVPEAKDRQSPQLFVTRELTGGVLKQ